MALFYQAADVVVARSGANTVAELAVVGVPVDPGAASRTRPETINRPTPRSSSAPAPR